MRRDGANHQHPYHQRTEWDVQPVQPGDRRDQQEAQPVNQQRPQDHRGTFGTRLQEPSGRHRHQHRQQRRDRAQVTDIGIAGLQAQSKGGVKGCRAAQNTRPEQFDHQVIGVAMLDVLWI